MDILLIDDDAVDRISTIRTLKASDLPLGNIDQAQTAKDGIRMASLHNYGVVLLDYQIPPYTGIEILREIRGGNDYSTAIVMVSHSNDEDLALSCIEAGAQDFVMKSELSATRLKRAILIASERHDLEMQVRDSHDRLRHLAERDSLTGLRNRYFFDEALKDAVSKATRSKQQLALILLDIDKFKNINDTLGHQAGDYFLQQTARRLEKPVRESDKLCRLGGDEFAILVFDLVHPTQIRLLANRICDALATPIEIQGESHDITASIGIATYPDCATDAVGLMKCADVAMYRAKELGRNQVQYYSREFHEQMQSRVRLENELKQALADNQLTLFYQPQIDAQSGKMSSVEALIRWRHETRGLLAPITFIPIAEESNLIIEIGRWVIKTACQQLHDWKKRLSLQDITFSIAINLSAQQLKDSGLSVFIENCLREYDIPPSDIELELTEGSLENSIEAIDVLQRLEGLGVKLALDDFGTGYSSLSHLKEYPFSVLKIDKSFVQGIHDNKQASLLNAICSFAQSLGYETVAEGVETEEQKAFCHKLNVTRFQGFLFSKPISAQELEKHWLNQD